MKFNDRIEEMMAEANDVKDLQKLMTHHYNEIKRLRKGKDLNKYDTEHKEELIAFLDKEMGKFKKAME